MFKLFQFYDYDISKENRLDMLLSRKKKICFILKIKRIFTKCRNIIKGVYERPEKYISKKNNTRKIKKNYL
jgi:hypothetical protein